MSEEVKIPIEVSARHAHLSQEDVDVLFGKGYKLTNKRELSQKGYYVANETIEVVGKKGSATFGILLPERSQSQIEVAITDAIKLGIDPVLTNSGELENTSGCIMKGPKGEIVLDKGVMVAARHLHINDEVAQKLNVVDKDYIDVEVNGPRPVIFKDVLVRVDPSFGISMHIDTDEANAAGVNNKELTYGRKVEV